MESRYALRELEGAIGYDGRYLEDGRRAIFRHTALYKRARRDWFERRDLMLFLQTSALSTSCLGANIKIDLESFDDVISDLKNRLMSVIFPYQKIEKKNKKQSNETNFDSYFDELEELERQRKLNQDNMSKTDDDNAIDST